MIWPSAFRRNICCFALSTLLALTAQPLAAARAEVPAAGYRLGVFPYLSPRQAIEFFGPMALSMETVLKRPVILESVPTFADFSREMAARRYDIAMIQPFDYPEVVDKLGYLPLAQYDAPLVTQFVVREDSYFRTIDDLRGTTVALPPAPSANARMALRALHDNKLTPGSNVEVQHFNSHDSCIHQVWIGSASACGTSRSPLAVFEQRMQAKLRSIHDTPPIPHTLFVIHPRVPAEQRKQLRQLITGWSQTEQGRTMLARAGFPGFVVPRPADYAVMRNYGPPANADKTIGSELVLGVLPYLPARNLAEHVGPTLPRLSKSAGVPVSLATASTFEQFWAQVSAAKYDIALVQPYEYARATKAGYQPLLAAMKGFRGVFFVRADSPYQKLDDLRGNVVAMPPEDSAVSIRAREQLAKTGLDAPDAVTVRYYVSHPTCFAALARGEAAVCVSSHEVVNMMAASTGKELRVIAESDPLPGVLFMTHRRVAADKRERLRQEIASWPQSAEGRRLLQSLGFGDFGPVDKSAYEALTPYRRSLR
jgi:phosphonate transport system substrate-binding protein